MTELEKEKQETRQRLLNALQELHDACDNLNVLMGTPSSLCVFCHSRFYNASGIIHEHDCVMVKTRFALQEGDKT